MAISVVNVTHNDASLVSPTVLHTVTIPATSVGNTLIVLSSAHSNGAEADDASDSEVGFGLYTKPIAARSHPSFWESVVLQYRVGIAAGITSVTVHYGGGTLGITSSVTILEVAGINNASPLETSNTKTTTATTSNPIGNATTTAFTNALFVGLATSTSGTMNTLNNSWTRGNTDIADHKHGYFIGSGTSTMSINNTSSNNQTYIVGTAVFNPTANIFTLDLSDSTTLDDTDLNETSYVMSKSDSITLADAFDAVLSTLTHFKTLFDAVTTADSFSAVIAFMRSLGDSVTMIDSISYIHDSQRTLADSIRVQDWLEVQRNGSHWGN